MMYSTNASVDNAIVVMILLRCMAMTQCDQCNKDIIRPAFCGTNCRVKHFRGLAEAKNPHKRPDAILQSPRFAPRVKQNEHGEFLNAPGMQNPAYNYDRGYAEPAIEL